MSISAFYGHVYLSLFLSVEKVEVVTATSASNVKGGHTSTTVVDHDRLKQENWLLLELQKVRQQMEAHESRLLQRNVYNVDQETFRDFTYRINDIEVC